ncbi:hypothetical protein NSQ59_07455 [Margalitia sp. FSL K6-0131]|uniref:hypothetical protein n=1 Tax=Margalitia sp. FSL K6-0131 TaxID=2954604 RepID=UPI0030FA2A80
MPYKVINRFRDKDNNNILYREGDQYPVEGYEASNERIQELSTEHPLHKKVFIEKVETEDDKVTREAKETEERAAIRAELETMGVSVHPNTGLEKLKEKLEEAKAEKKTEE